MSNIYLTVTIEKKWRTQNLDFKRLKISSPGHLLGSFNLPKYHWIFKLFVATLKSKGCFQKLEPTSPSSFFWPTPKFYGLMLPTPKFRLTPSAPFFFRPIPLTHKFGSRYPRGCADNAARATWASHAIWRAHTPTARGGAGLR